MTLKSLMIVHAMIAFILGLSLVISPAASLAMLGVLNLGTVGAELTRLLGAAFLGFGFITLVARDIKTGHIERNREGWSIVLALAVFYLVGFLVLLIGQLTGAWNSLGWLLVGLSLLFGAGFAVFLVRHLSS